MEEGAGRKVGSCFFAAGRRLATDFYGGGTLRPPIFPLFSPQRRRTRLAGTQVRHVPSHPPERTLRKKRQRPAPSPVPAAVPAPRPDWRSIPALKSSPPYRSYRAVSSRPAGIAWHLARQPRQQQAVAC